MQGKLPMNDDTPKEHIIIPVQATVAVQREDGRYPMYRTIRMNGGD